MFDYPTINAIANYLLGLLIPEEQREQASQSAHVQGPPIHSAAAIAAMSDEEIAKLL
jgi:hypothetical protein